VRTILHLSGEQRLDESFLVERHEAGLFVELRGADSTLIGQRTLPSSGNCDELAQAAAVVLSAWLTDVHPDFAGALPTPEPAPEPEPEPAPAAVPEPEPAPPPRPARVVLAPKPHPRPTGSRRLQLSLAGGADLSGSKPAVAALGALALLPRESGWGATLFVLADAPRRQALGNGAVLWRRWPVGAGPTLRVASSGVAWDFSLGPALSWVHLAGRDFDDNATHDAPTWSGFASVRLASRGRLGVFGQLLTQVFLGNPTASGADADYRLPRVGVALLLGAHGTP